MPNVAIVCLNNLPFLPYIHGLLRAAIVSEAALASRYQFCDPIFLSDTPERIVSRMQAPSIVGLSCYVWNFKRHTKIARLVKARWPQTLVVAGGPHIPDHAEDFLLSHEAVDICVHGEGETAFLEILRQYAKPNPQWNEVPGISFRSGSRVVRTLGLPRGSKTIPLRSVYQLGYLDSAIESCQKRGLEFYAPWETNRGCPFACTFCDWGAATMSAVRRFPDAQLQADVAYFANRKISNVFVCDANFGMLARDVEIARALATANSQSGFPKQIRVNFAKNSNARVLSISKIFAERGLQMGTTLSLQSTSDSVLEAVQRSNIHFGDLKKLLAQYEEAGVHTYTELILGLPRETLSSFKDGLAKILEAGNHHDIRVYELTLLPNAPMTALRNASDHLLRTIDKRIYAVEPGVPDDEIEVAPLVIETASLSRSDWIECALFSQIIQTLHNGGLLRFVAIHLFRATDLGYRHFYESLISHFAVRPTTVLGGALASMRRLYERYMEDPALPQLHLVVSAPELAEFVSRYGRRRSWRVDDWCWLAICEVLDQFYREVDAWLSTLKVVGHDELDDLLAFQRDVILRAEYDPHVGKLGRYQHNFYDYFAFGAPLARRDQLVHWMDRAMGPNEIYPLIPNDKGAFALAAVGPSYPFTRIRHYVHQFDRAKLLSEPANESAFPAREPTPNVA